MKKKLLPLSLSILLTLTLSQKMMAAETQNLHGDDALAATAIVAGASVLISGLAVSVLLKSEDTRNLIEKSEIDAVISVSGVPQQAIPTNAALFHRKLGLPRTTVAFDINSTCLSFLTGLFCMGNLIAQGVYRHVLLISSDISSVGLNPKDAKTASLFGDGAAACVLGAGEVGGIISTYFETRSENADDCKCEGGGTLLAMKKDTSIERHYFRMNGPRLFKAAMPSVLKMVQNMTSESKVDLYIPHQASPLALDLLQKKLNISDQQFMNIVRDYGNMIATSIPFALHMAIEEGRLQRGNNTLLFGTGAGLTIGGVLLEY